MLPEQNPYTTGLDKTPANYVPLSPLTFIERAATVYPAVTAVVHGDRRAAEPLTQLPDVQGVSFVGTSRVCQTIAAQCAANNKRCQALGSAKNPLVALPDAKMDEMIRNMITSCYGCAGQRCMASSAIVAASKPAKACGSLLKSFSVSACSHVSRKPRSLLLAR